MAHARFFIVAAVIAASALAPGRGDCVPHCPEAGASDAAQDPACGAAPQLPAVAPPDAAPASNERNAAAAPPAIPAAESIYKCTGADGAEVLQNAPCGTTAGADAQAQAVAADSPGAASAAAPRAAHASEPAGEPGGDADAGAARAAAPPPGFTGEPGTTAASTAEDSANLPGEPALGMTPGQVQAILGPPLAVTQEEVVQGRVVTWIYGDSRTLQFDTSGRLSSK